LIRDYDTEAEALVMVRELLAVGWSAEDLGLALDFDDGEDGDDASLPPAIRGRELAARALPSGRTVADPDKARRLA
jgi:hypothetical protein